MCCFLDTLDFVQCNGSLKCLQWDDILGFIDAAGEIVYSGVTPSGIRYWEVGGPSGEAPGPPPDEVVPGPPPAEEDEKDFPGRNPGKRPAA